MTYSVYEFEVSYQEAERYFISHDEIATTGKYNHANKTMVVVSAGVERASAVVKNRFSFQRDVEIKLKNVMPVDVLLFDIVHTNYNHEILQSSLP